MPKTLGQGNLHYRAPLTLVVGFYNSGPNPCKLRHGGVTIVTLVLSHTGAIAQDATLHYRAFGPEGYRQ